MSLYCCVNVEVILLQLFIRLSGIPSSLSSALPFLSDSTSINKLNIIKTSVFRDHRYQFLNFYCLLLPILVYAVALFL